MKNMAETYLGIGRFNIILFLVIYFMVVGVVGSLFDPTFYADKSLTENDVNNGIDVWGMDSKVQGQTKTALLQQVNPTLWNAWDNIVKIFTTFLSLIFIGMTFSIPNVPTAVQLFMSVPVIILFAFIILDLVIDILKAVFKVPLSG